MKNLFLTFTLALSLLTFAACSTSHQLTEVEPASSASIVAPSDEFRESLGFVLIDKLNPAYVVYYGIPANIDAETLADLETNASETDTLYLIPSADFVGIDLASDIALNEYENEEVGAGILELIRQYPMTPFGLTWNGGVAFTYNDYLFAEGLYEQYQSEPDQYLVTNERDLRVDPTNPVNHLGPLLGQS